MGETKPPRHCAILNCRAGAQKQTPLQVLCSSPQADVFFFGWPKNRGSVTIFLGCHLSTLIDVRHEFLAHTFCGILSDDLGKNARRFASINFHWKMFGVSKVRDQLQASKRELTTKTFCSL